MPKIFSSHKYEIGDILQHPEVATCYEIKGTFYDKDEEIYMYTTKNIASKYKSFLPQKLIDSSEFVKIGTRKENPEYLL